MKYYQLNASIYLILAIVIFIGMRWMFDNHYRVKVQREMDKYVSIHQDRIVNIDDRSKTSINEPVEKTRETEDSEQKFESLRSAKSIRITKRPVPATININSADQTALMTLNGIGPVLSERIIKFRNRLGGFHSVSQLADVYGLEGDVYSRLKNRLICAGTISKIDINSAEFKELLRHPYLAYEEVKHIKNYIRKKGPIVDNISLQEATKKSEIEVSKLLPYIRFEESGKPPQSVDSISK